MFHQRQSLLGCGTTYNGISPSAKRHQVALARAKETYKNAQTNAHEDLILQFSAPQLADGEDVNNAVEDVRLIAARLSTVILGPTFMQALVQELQSITTSWIRVGSWPFWWLPGCVWAALHCVQKRAATIAGGHHILTTTSVPYSILQSLLSRYFKISYQQHMEENHGFLFTSQQVEQHLIYGLDPVIMEMAKNLQVSAITTHEMLVAHFQAEDGSTLIHNAFLQAAVILFSNICKARAAAGIHDRNVIPWDKLLQYKPTTGMLLRDSGCPELRVHDWQISKQQWKRYARAWAEQHPTAAQHQLLDTSLPHILDSCMPLIELVLDNDTPSAPVVTQQCSEQADGQLSNATAPAVMHAHSEQAVHDAASAPAAPRKRRQPADRAPTINNSKPGSVVLSSFIKSTTVGSTAYLNKHYKLSKAAYTTLVQQWDLKWQHQWPRLLKGTMNFRLTAAQLKSTHGSASWKFRKAVRQYLTSRRIYTLAQRAHMLAHGDKLPVRVAPLSNNDKTLCEQQLGVSDTALQKEVHEFDAEGRESDEDDFTDGQFKSLFDEYCFEPASNSDGDIDTVNLADNAGCADDGQCFLSSPSPSPSPSPPPTPRVSGTAAQSIVWKIQRIHPALIGHSDLFRLPDGTKAWGTYATVNTAIPSPQPDNPTAEHSPHHPVVLETIKGAGTSLSPSSIPSPPITSPFDLPSMDAVRKNTTPLPAIPAPNVSAPPKCKPFDLAAASKLKWSEYKEERPASTDPFLSKWRTTVLSWVMTARSVDGLDADGNIKSEIVDAILFNRLHTALQTNLRVANGQDSSLQGLTIAGIEETLFKSTKAQIKRRCEDEVQRLQYDNTRTWAVNKQSLFDMLYWCNYSDERVWSLIAAWMSGRTKMWEMMQNKKVGGHRFQMERHNATQRDVTKLWAALDRVEEDLAAMPKSVQHQTAMVMAPNPAKRSAPSNQLSDDMWQQWLALRRLASKLSPVERQQRHGADYDRLGGCTACNKHHPGFPCRPSKAPRTHQQKPNHSQSNHHAPSANQSLASVQHELATLRQQTQQLFTHFHSSHHQPTPAPPPPTYPPPPDPSLLPPHLHPTAANFNALPPHLANPPPPPPPPRQQPRGQRHRRGQGRQ